MEDRELLTQVPGLLLSWYDKNARVLPWREDPSPYRVWVSEIMLQQTRVEAVKPYYERFLTALPTVADLAAAPEEQLLKLWEGLGYYNRVRNLQKGAKAVMERHGGVIPADFDALRALPGIGDYTAGAIASIAFQLPVPAVDGNVLRVTARLLDRHDNILDPKVKRRTEGEITAILPARVGDFNQSLMELGAMVCLPNGAPLCGTCPPCLPVQGPGPGEPGGPAGKGQTQAPPGGGPHPVPPHLRREAGPAPPPGHRPAGRAVGAPRRRRDAHPGESGGAPGPLGPEYYRRFGARQTLQARVLPRGVAHDRLAGPGGGGGARLCLGHPGGAPAGIPPALGLRGLFPQRGEGGKNWREALTPLPFCYKIKG